jgi:hypothetical protein
VVPAVLDCGLACQSAHLPNLAHLAQVTIDLLDLFLKLFITITIPSLLGKVRSAPACTT